MRTSLQGSYGRHEVLFCCPRNVPASHWKPHRSHSHMGQNPSHDKTLGHSPGGCENPFRSLSLHGSSQATRTRTLFIRRIPFSLDWAVLEFLFRHRIGLSTAPGVAAMGFDPDSASRPLPSSYSVHIPAEAPTSARASMRRGVEVHVVSTGGADRAATGRDGLRPITLPTGGAWAKGSSASAIR